MNIKCVNEEDSRIGNFINEEFSAYGEQNNVDLNFNEFCFIAESDDGEIIGVITGHAYYNEVHIGDLIVHKAHRKCGLGSKLVSAVEEAFRNAEYDKITLTTFGFQAPEFYKKLGYTVEFIREDKNPKLCKYFLSKHITR
ncbi:MAG: GNAT family N-acetyltransferase [Oscillospiraceae bacterium]|nr:GNAT family N-acetyltransferase [Oscillospiraceae bacterium]